MHLKSKLIPCRCGCGELIHAINWLGKPAEFKTHHNNNMPERTSKWKGGRIVIYGYVFIYKPDHPHKTRQDYVREHRLVMESKLGRYLEPDEFVHHINGDKQDNRFENLLLVKSSKHASIHNKYRKRDEYGRFT